MVNKETNIRIYSKEMSFIDTTIDMHNDDGIIYITWIYVRGGTKITELIPPE